MGNCLPLSIALRGGRCFARVGDLLIPTDEEGALGGGWSLGAGYRQALLQQGLELDESLRVEIGVEFSAGLREGRARIFEEVEEEEDEVEDDEGPLTRLYGENPALRGQPAGRRARILGAIAIRNFIDDLNAELAILDYEGNEEDLDALVRELTYEYRLLCIPAEELQAG